MRCHANPSESSHVDNRSELKTAGLCLCWRIDLVQRVCASKARARGAHKRAGAASEYILYAATCHLANRTAFQAVATSNEDADLELRPASDLAACFVSLDLERGHLERQADELLFPPHSLAQFLHATLRRRVFIAELGDGRPPFCGHKPPSHAQLKPELH